jgi:uncharacterized membrane protein YkvI
MKRGDILKNSHFKNIIKIASVYAGTILGAGFASGREITQYFIGYGNEGFWGLILAGVMFGVVGWAVMSITYNNNIKSYKEFLNILFGTVLGNLMEIASVLFMFVIFSTMLSAAGAIAQQSGVISSIIAILVLSTICAITLAFDIKAIIIVNSIVSPILLFGGICLGLYAFLEKTIPTFYNVTVLEQNFIFSAIIYVAYNIITAVSVLTNMRELVNTKNIAKYGGLLGGFSLGVMGICLGLGIMVNYSEIGELEIPILAIAKSFGMSIERFYLIMLVMAVYSTASVNGYAIMTWALKKFKIKKYLFILLFIVAGALAAQIQFSNFVGAVYPVFGYIGIFEMVVIVTNFLIPCRLQS